MRNPQFNRIWTDEHFVQFCRLRQENPEGFRPDTINSFMTHPHGGKKVSWDTLINGLRYRLNQGKLVIPEKYCGWMPLQVAMLAEWNRERPGRVPPKPRKNEGWNAYAERLADTMSAKPRAAAKPAAQPTPRGPQTLPDGFTATIRDGRVYLVFPDGTEALFKP